MKKGKLTAKIFAIALVFGMIGTMLGGLLGTVNIASAEPPIYEFLVYVNFGSDNSCYTPGQGVGGYEDRLYVATGYQYCYVYEVSIPEGADPNMHPDNPEAKGPMAPRTLTLLEIHDIQADIGNIWQSQNEFYVDDTGIYYGPNGGIHKWDHNWNYQGRVVTVDPPSINHRTQTLAYDPATDTWYAGGGVQGSSPRPVYSFRPGINTSWQYEFSYPEFPGWSGSNRHHDGLEYVNGYLWVSDMTSNWIGQWKKNPDGSWEEMARFTYENPVDDDVEGMGFGPLGHLWATGWSRIYEIGGRELGVVIKGVDLSIRLDKNEYNPNEMMELSLIVTDKDGNNIYPLTIDDIEVKINGNYVNIEDQRINKAINWAEKWCAGSPQPGGPHASENYKTYCLAFVQDAYQYGAHTYVKRYEYPNKAAEELNLHTTGVPPPGAYVFYKVPSGEWADYGHVGLSLGGDKVVHAHHQYGPVMDGDYKKLTRGYGNLIYIGWAWPPIGITQVNEECLIKVKAPSEVGEHNVWVQVVTDLGSASDEKTFTVGRVPILLVHGAQMLPPWPFTFDPRGGWEEMAEALTGKDISEAEQVPGYSFWKLESKDEDHFTVYISNYASGEGPTKEDIRFYATNLADEISAIRSDAGVSEIDIVTHSMGGLVARAYIESEDLDFLEGHELYEDLRYNDDVRKLIMLGTPNHGVTTWILLLDVVPAGVELYWDIESCLTALAWSYLGCCVLPEDKREECIDECTNECTKCLEELENELIEWLQEEKNAATIQMIHEDSPFASFLIPLNGGKTGEDLGAEYSTIAGTYYDQSGSILHPTTWKFLLRAGDGYVLSESVKLDETVRSGRHFEHPLTHTGLPISDWAIQKVMYVLLSNFDREPIDLRYPHPIYHYYCCPVNVTITDEYGRIIDDQATNEIPGAYFEERVMEEVKIFRLPPDLSYNSTITAYNQGNFTLIEVIPATTDTMLINVFGSIATTNETRAAIEIVSSETMRPMAIDYDGDGVIDEVRSPDVSEFLSDMWIDVMTSEEMLGAEQHTGVIETLADKPCNLTVYIKNTGDQVLHNVQIIANVGVTKDIGDISGREVKQVPIEFTPTTPGLNALNVTVKSDEIERSLTRTLLVEKFDFTVAIPKTQYELNEPVAINISVTNEVPNIRFIELEIEINISGSYDQTFEIPLLSLAPLVIKDTTFTWDTTGIGGGRYTITTSLVMADQVVMTDTKLISLGNQPPVADAGPDQTVCVIPPATTAMVTLDGSGSYDADGDPLTYNWTWDDNTACGVNPTVELPLGTTTITLVVNDGKVDSVPDTVDITVRIPATIDFDPDVINLDTKGKYVTVYIELPPGYDVGQIDISSIRLNDTVPALGKPTEIGDCDSDGVPDLMVKFHRTMVQDVLAAGEDVEVTITGEIDGITFVGSDYIRVIAPAVAHGHSK